MWFLAMFQLIFLFCQIGNWQIATWMYSQTETERTVGKNCMKVNECRV